MEWKSGMSEEKWSKIPSNLPILRPIRTGWVSKTDIVSAIR